MDAPSAALMSLDAVNAFLETDFPQIAPGREFILYAVGPMTARMRLKASAGLLSTSASRLIVW